MDEIERLIREDLEIQKVLRTSYIRRLKQLQKKNKSILSIYLMRNGEYYKKIEGGKRIYLGKIDGKNSDEIKTIQTARYLEEAIKRTDDNIKGSEQFLKKYQSNSPSEITKALPSAYQLVPLQEYQLAFSENDYSKWEYAPYEHNTSFLDQLQHRTVKGHFVRSKSELNIANMLFYRGIPYHYEEMVMVGGQFLSPDFKIYVRSERRFKLLEHFGMIGNPTYLEDCTQRFKTYVRNGYRPWKDICFTYDFQDGGLDSHEIDNLITQHFI